MTDTTDARPDIFVYVLHSPWMKVREANIANLQRLCALSATPRIHVSLVIAHEPADIPQALIKSIVDVSVVPGSVPETFTPFLKTLHVNQLSNTLKHLTAFRMIGEHAKFCPRAAHVVVEDDVLFNDDVVRMLTNALASAPAAYDLVFLGMPSSRAGTIDAMHFEPTRNMFSVFPCCDSYVITPAAATKLAEAFLPVRFATQVHLSYLMDKLSLQSFLCLPNIFMDGSKVGVYMSSINVNNMLIWNMQYNEVRALLAKPGGPTADDLQKIDAVLPVALFKDHPDFRYLAGKAHMIQKRLPEARKEFDSAFEIYVAERCLFGPECQFMKDYTRLFGLLQS